MDAREVLNLLRVRYAAPAYALLDEVGNATGSGCCRHADAVAMGLWPSRGLDVQGFEIKVSGSDWRRELDNPEKADPIFQYCDHWWVVAPKGVISMDTVPPNWGLMEATTRGLKATKVAPPLTAKPLSRQFIAALLRRSAEWTQKVSQSCERFHEGYNKGKADSKREIEILKFHYDSLNEKVTAFEKASGVDLSVSWNAGRIGDAVREVVNGQHLTRRQALQQYEVFLTNQLDRVKQEIGAGGRDGSPTEGAGGAVAAGREVGRPEPRRLEVAPHPDGRGRGGVGGDAGG